MYGFVDLLSSCCLIQLLLHKSSAVRETWEKNLCALAGWRDLNLLSSWEIMTQHWSLQVFALCFSIETLRFISALHWNLQGCCWAKKNSIAKTFPLLRTFNIVNIKKFSSIERKSWRFFRASEQRENSPQEIIINKWRDTLRRWDWIIFSLCFRW